MCPVGISAGKPALLRENIRGFPRSLQVNAAIVLRIDVDNFLLNPYQVHILWLVFTVPLLSWSHVMTTPLLWRYHCFYDPYVVKISLFTICRSCHKPNACPMEKVTQMWVHFDVNPGTEQEFWVFCGKINILFIFSLPDWLPDWLIGWLPGWLTDLLPNYCWPSPA